ncbi:ATP-binding protein [Streptomyces sp. NPDC014889]|uniref:ATP-binding protein n=1 Tax=Streptomyces sp. NPDC014889 TaxID=3364928 RepID=UPI0036FA17C1
MVRRCVGCHRGRRAPRLPGGFCGRYLLDGASSDVVDTAQLLVSELVTNAVMHAQTEVEVRVWAVDGRVHVHVSDQNPNRVLVPHTGGTAYAGTGRGLAMVEQLASSHQPGAADLGLEHSCHATWCGGDRGAGRSARRAASGGPAAPRRTAA